jgi:hypothetical protein
VLPSSHSRRIAWASAVVIAIITRTVALGRWPGLNGDESWYGVNVEEFLAGGTPFLHTPPGNPLSPLHSGLLLALSSVLDASPSVLRMPEVILGMLAVLLAYPLLRKPLGGRAALLATVLLAVSPAAITYARFGWDPSGTPLLMLLAVAAALHDRPVFVLIAMAVAYLVHPTNVFAFPIVAAAWAPSGLARYRRMSSPGQRRTWHAAIAAMIVVMPVGIWALIRIANNPATPLPSISMALERLVSPALWLDRAWGAFSLLSGVTPVAFVAGPLPSLAVVCAAGLIGLIVVGSLVFTWRQWWGHHYAGWLAGGVAAGFAGFHIVAVPFAFHPGFERYALFLLVPMLIVVAIALDAAIERAASVGTGSAATVVVTMLMVIGGGYFYPLATRGGAGDVTFRTGAVEPKLAAFRFIDNDSHDAGAVTIVADDWWLYWSIRYFAGAQSRFNVEPGPAASILGGTHPRSAARLPIPAAQRTYRVKFAEPGLPAEQSNARFTATDPLGHPIVEVLLLPQQDRP